MMDASEAIDGYLIARFGISLEQVLADATADAVTFSIAGSVKVTCNRIGSFPYEDGGTSEVYQGVLVVEGVTYRLRFVIFTDFGGARFVESIGELELVRWDVRLAVPKSEMRNG